jgi:mono/diheme cytochrome c family protein
MSLRSTTFGIGMVGALVLAACGGDDTTPAPNNQTDAGTDVSSGGDSAPSNEGSVANEGGATSEGGEGGLTGAALVARGDYIVNHVAACPDCHTPRDMMGKPVMDKFLAGSTVPFADIVPDSIDGGVGVGKIYVKNITPDKTTGIGSWTDDQIKNAFLNGLEPQADGGARPLFPIMPYFVFHNMNAQDANAVVAYLRSVTAVANAIPANEPLPFPLPIPAPPVPADKIPDTTLAKTDPNYAKAEAGRYLAGNIGICMECHTEHNMAGFPVLKETALFAGNNPFGSAELGLPPVYPMTIYSANLTQDDTGLKGWDAADVAQVLATGTDKKGRALCPPMPFGPMGAFGGLTPEDQLNIGYFITSLPPIANPNIPWCNDPFRSPMDGGSDAPAE